MRRVRSHDTLESKSQPQPNAFYTFKTILIDLHVKVVTLYPRCSFAESILCFVFEYTLSGCAVIAMSSEFSYTMKKRFKHSDRNGYFSTISQAFTF